MKAENIDDVKLGVRLIIIGALGILIFYGVLFSALGLLYLSNPFFYYAIHIFTGFCGITVFFGIYIGKESKRDGALICLIMGIITSITQFIYFNSIPLTLTLLFLRIEPALIILGSVIVLTSKDVLQKPLKKKHKKLLITFPIILSIIFPITTLFYP